VSDIILDPFAGTGTTAIVAKQLKRQSVSIEIDETNIEQIENRLSEMRKADLIEKYFESYKFTENLAEIWGKNDDLARQNIAERNVKTFGVG
jgi:tRNA G10  N-methylase Trm11